MAFSLPRRALTSALLYAVAHLAAMKANGLKLLIGDEAYSFDPATRALTKGIMLAVQSIAEAFGVNFHVDAERRIESACKVSAE